MRKFGFTLAEVLITLSIISVVSILTLPSIIKNYRYKTYSAALEKTYSQITDAVNTIMVDEMAETFATTSASLPSRCGYNDGKDAGACYFLRNYFKVANLCASGTQITKCASRTYKSINGANANGIFGEDCIQTTNGAGICMGYNANTKVMNVFIDVNGPSQPNIIGLDAFVAVINGNTGEVTDWSNNADSCNKKVSSYNHVGDYASGCLYKVMRNGWVISE